MQPRCSITEPRIKVGLRKAKYMAMEFISGMTAPDTKESFKMDLSTELENLIYLTSTHTKEVLKTTPCLALAPVIGTMENFTTVNGKMGNNMELVFSRMSTVGSARPNSTRELKLLGLIKKFR